MKKVEVLTICGSMKFYKEMIIAAEELELQKGYATIQCVYNLDGKRYENVNAEELNRIHLKKIDISDGIFVVNKDGYIGETTKKEIEYAKAQGKKVMYLEKHD